MDPADIADVSLKTRVRDGHVEKAPFRLVVAGATLGW